MVDELSSVFNSVVGAVRLAYILSIHGNSLKNFGTVV